MKTKAFQTKRKPKGGFRILHAKTRKRKQRVSAAASGGDFTVEEPNLGVARALVVILILHLAAIGAIVVHHKSTKSDLAVKETPATSTNQNSKTNAAASKQAVAKIGPNDKWEWVAAGDTYERIARKHNLSADALRRLNNNQPLQVGYAIKLPMDQPSVAPAIAQTPADPILREQLPPIVEVPVRNNMPPEYERVSEPQPVVQNNPVFPIEEPVNQPTVDIRQVSTRVAPPVEPTPEPVAEPVVQEKPKPKPVANKTYTIRKGDTLWAIANRNGVSVDALTKANRNLNPKTLKIGARVVIPTR